MSTESAAKPVYNPKGFNTSFKRMYFHQLTRNLIYGSNPRDANNLAKVLQFIDNKFGADFFSNLAEDDHSRGQFLYFVYKNAMDVDNNTDINVPYPLPEHSLLRYLIDCYRPDATEEQRRHRFPDPLYLIPGFAFFIWGKENADRLFSYVKMIVGLLPPSSVNFQKYCNITFRAFEKHNMSWMTSFSINMFSVFSLQDVPVMFGKEDMLPFASKVYKLLDFFLEATVENWHRSGVEEARVGGRAELSKAALFRNTAVRIHGVEYSSLLDALRGNTGDVYKFDISSKALEWVFQSLSVNGPPDFSVLESMIEATLLDSEKADAEHLEKMKEDLKKMKEESDKRELSRKMSREYAKQMGLEPDGDRNGKRVKVESIDDASSDEEDLFATRIAGF